MIYSVGAFPEPSNPPYSVRTLHIRGNQTGRKLTTGEIQNAGGRRYTYQYFTNCAAVPPKARATPRGNTHPGEIKRTSAHTRLTHAYCDRYCDSRTDAHTDSVAPACHAHVHGHRNTYCCLHAQRLCAAMMPSTSMRYRGVPCMTCIREGSIPKHRQPSHEERGIMVACHPIHPTLETL